MRLLRHIAPLLCLTLLLSHTAAAARDITLYVYHQKPPYVVDAQRGRGLYYELARRLNGLQSQFTFRTVLLPRKRLESLLEQEQLDGLVLGVNPHWFNDAAQQRYGWSAPWIHDRDMPMKAAPWKSCWSTGWTP